MSVVNKKRDRRNLRLKAGRYYYAEGTGGWYVSKNANLRDARSQAVEEFGRGEVEVVRRATLEEARSYAVWWGYPPERWQEWFDWD